MRTRTKVALGVVVAIAALGALAWQRYWYYLPGLIADVRDPVHDNRPVEWQPGPDTAAQPPGQRPPNIILIVADDSVSTISRFERGRRRGWSGADAEHRLDRARRHPRSPMAIPATRPARPRELRS